VTEAPLQHGGQPPVGAAEDGSDWLDLSTGIAPSAYPFTPPPAQAWRSLPRQAEEQAALTAAACYFGLTGEEEICSGPGSQALLQLLPRLLPTAPAAVLAPTYNEHAHRWSVAGHKVEEIPAIADLSGPCRYLVVVNPNNPSGAIQGREELLRLADEMAAREGYLIVDEAFCDLRPDVSVAPEAGRPGLLVLRSFGKFFGLAGLRLGFLLGPAPLISSVRQHLGPWPVNGPALDVAAQAYDDRAWIAGHRKALAEQAEKLRQLLSEHGHIVGGTDLFVLLQSDNSPAIRDRLAAGRIHVRDFAEHETWLRFGLPGDEAAWRRLEDALQCPS
jgi:cobalamin biosynthetic protein CobC